MLVINKNEMKSNEIKSKEKIKIRTKMIKILTMFPGNGTKFDNVVVDA